MASGENLIDFDIIETQKENIQSLPSGRSAKALASVLSPLSARPTPPLSQTQTLNNAIRAEYEKELLTIDECDDPLDVYDRYVKWALDAYPSAQATSQSGLLPLLERATKAFLATTNYKNDPRYLKLWLHYIRLFSDAPRETFSYLSRHGIGETLALFYEEFAAWLEGAGRWTQAEEVYKMGIEKEAHPASRLIRKFGEFERRLQNKPDDPTEPTSPALPTVRPALAAKIDPFALTSPAPTSADPQAASRSSGSKKSKLEIFSDSSATEERPESGSSVRGWEQHGTLADRRKENVVGARPWAGETMKSTSQNISVPKMTIFKDQTINPNPNPLSPPHPSVDQKGVNPKTGRIERVFVNLEAIYPDPGNPSVEYCFEELRAAKRGWLQRDWRSAEITQQKPFSKPSDNDTMLLSVDAAIAKEKTDVSHGETKQRTDAFERTVLLNDENAENVALLTDGSNQVHKSDASRRIRREEKANRTRKIKVMEVKGETTTVQTNLTSPQGPRIKRKARDREPTMTVHTKAATDEVYELFSAPLKTVTDNVVEEEEEESEDEGEESSDEDSDGDDDEYTSAGESTSTGHLSTGTASEYEEEGENEHTRGDVTGTTTKSDNSEEVSEAGEATKTCENTGWTDFNLAKDMPNHAEDQDVGTTTANEDVSKSSVRERPSTLDLSSVETAIAEAEQQQQHDEVTTPTSETPITNATTSYIPTKPSSSDYVRPNPYRDPALVAQSRLPFMTPIAEKTESSLGTATKDKDFFGSKTPCPKGSMKALSNLDDDICSSPFTEHIDLDVDEAAITGSKDQKILQPILEKITPASISEKPTVSASRGPLIPDTQLNPMSPTIQSLILSTMSPSLSSCSSFYDQRNNDAGTPQNMKADLKAFSKAFAAVKSSGKGDKTVSNTLPKSTELHFKDCGEQSNYKYVVKRELGRGAFAPVYLAERTRATDATQTCENGEESQNADEDSQLVAIKLEDDPPSAWEYHMLCLAFSLLQGTRAASSIIHAHSCYMYDSASFLIEQYRPRGTLLDAVNRLSEATNGAMDEAVAMFFAVELFEIMEALHSNGIIHGDIKADNLLLRVDTASISSNSFSCSTQAEALPPYTATGKSMPDDGWQDHGLTLIDFGRAVNMANFTKNVQFIADWQTTSADCPEMRELRPWTYQVDYYGIAGVLYVMLFGKWMDVVVSSTFDSSKGSDVEAAAGIGVGSKVYKLKEPLKRWWCTDIWADAFHMLLNPTRCVDKEEGLRMPVLNGMRDVRSRMEAWLEKNGEKGVGLRAWLRRLEAGKR